VDTPPLARGHAQLLCRDCSWHRGAWHFGRVCEHRKGIVRVSSKVGATVGAPQDEKSTFARRLAAERKMRCSASWPLSLLLLLCQLATVRCSGPHTSNQSTAHPPWSAAAASHGAAPSAAPVRPKGAPSKLRYPYRNATKTTLRHITTASAEAGGTQLKPDVALSYSNDAPHVGAGSVVFLLLASCVCCLVFRRAAPRPCPLHPTRSDQTRPNQTRRHAAPRRAAPHRTTPYHTTPHHTTPHHTTPQCALWLAKLPAARPASRPPTDA
jgi:hypothetical protein